MITYIESKRNSDGTYDHSEVIEACHAGARIDVLDKPTSRWCICGNARWWSDCKYRAVIEDEPTVKQSSSAEPLDREAIRNRESLASERIAFEKQCVRLGYSTSRDYRPYGLTDYYSDNSTEKAWQIWIARSGLDGIDPDESELRGKYQELIESYRKLNEVSLLAVRNSRNAALEEAAKVCDRHAGDIDVTGKEPQSWSVVRGAILVTGDMIRALQSKPAQPSDTEILDYLTGQVGVNRNDIKAAMQADREGS